MDVVTSGITAFGSVLDYWLEPPLIYLLGLSFMGAIVGSARRLLRGRG